MKTLEADRVLDTASAVDVKPREVQRLDAPPQPSKTGRSPRRVTAALVALLLITAIVAVVVWVLTAGGPATVTSPLYDQSITARDHAAGAVVSQPESLQDRSIRAREGAVVQQESVLDQSIRARDNAAQSAQGDSQLRQSARAREHAALIEQRDSLLNQSITARER